MNKRNVPQVGIGKFERPTEPAGRFQMEYLA
jgi:hypothetical protein